MGLQQRNFFQQARLAVVIKLGQQHRGYRTVIAAQEISQCNPDGQRFMLCGRTDTEIMVHEPGGHPPVFTSHLPVALVKTGKRSEEHTYELTSLMRRSYAVFCLE